MGTFENGARKKVPPTRSLSTDYFAFYSESSSINVSTGLKSMTQYKEMEEGT